MEELYKSSEEIYRANQDWASRVADSRKGTSRQWYSEVGVYGGIGELYGTMPPVPPYTAFARASALSTTISVSFAVFDTAFPIA